jgi:hypothetical protein
MSPGTRLGSPFVDVGESLLGLPARDDRGSAIDILLRVTAEES